MSPNIGRDGLKALGMLNSEEIAIASDPDIAQSEKHLPQPDHPPIIFGTGLSSRASIAALLKYGSIGSYELFALPQRVEAVRASLSPIATSVCPQKRITVHDHRVLLRNFDDLNIEAWYDAHADIWRSAYVRSNFSTRLYPIAGTIHTISYQSLLRKFYPSILLSETYPCDSIVCTSIAARNAFLNLLEKTALDLREEYHVELAYHGRLDVIPLGVDTQVFRPRDKPKARRALDLPEDRCIILCVGRLSISDKMDLFPLLHVFRECLQSRGRRDLLLVIAGTDRGGNLSSLEAEIRHLGIEEHVRIFLSPSSTAWLYSAADVFVSLSDNLQESFGNTILEALASGVPSIVSDWDGYRDTVEHGATGFRVATAWSCHDDDLALIAPLSNDNCAFDHTSVAQSVVVDIDSLKASLGALINNTSLRNEMSFRCRKRAEQLYSWPVIVQQYEALWHSLRMGIDRITFQPKRRARYAQPRFFKAFSGYPTHVLTGQSRIRITDAGQAALENRNSVPVHHLARKMGALDEKIVQEALEVLMDVPKDLSTHTQLGTSLNQIASAIPSARNHHPHSVIRHLQWLIKYGYAKVINGE